MLQAEFVKQRMSEVTAQGTRISLAVQAHINPEQRSNKWTVCLTSKGVIAYLNKRISPLGVHALPGQCVKTPCPSVDTIRRHLASACAPDVNALGTAQCMSESA